MENSNKVEVKVDTHSGYDKSFYVWSPHLCLEVDYDDVNHPEVDATTRQLKEIIEANWSEEKHKQYYKEELLREWEKNESNLQRDYGNNLGEYLEDHGVEP